MEATLNIHDDLMEFVSPNGTGALAFKDGAILFTGNVAVAADTFVTLLKNHFSAVRTFNHPSISVHEDTISFVLKDTPLILFLENGKPHSFGGAPLNDKAIQFVTQVLKKWNSNG